MKSTATEEKWLQRQGKMKADSRGVKVTVARFTVMRLMLVVLLLLSAPVPPVSLAGSAKPLVAVMPFQEALIDTHQPPHWWWREGPAIMDAIRERFTHRLIETGEVRVLERSRLDQIFQELRFQQSEWADPFDAVQVGRMLGAQYLLMGIVTKLDAHQTGYLDGGDVVLRGIGADVGLQVRIVETETGVALASVASSGSVRSGHLTVYSPAPISAAVRGQSVLERAINQAVDELAEKVVASFKDILEDGND